MNNFFLGYTEIEENQAILPVYQDESNRLNRHNALIGSSGVGKTCTLLHLCLAKAEKGDTVVVFDYNNIFAEDQIPEPFRNRLNAVKSDIDVHMNGFHCDILSPIKFDDGTQEMLEDVADSFADIVSRNMKFKGPRQVSRLREAAIAAFKEYPRRGIAAVGDKLEEMEDPQSIALKDKLGAFFRHNVFRSGEFSIKAGRINIIRLSKFATEAQFAVTELILSYIFRLASVRALSLPNLSIMIDEAHNISGAQGIVSTILTEGRKYGISVTVATQSMQQVKSSKALLALFQASNIFFFQPAKNEVQEIAKYIDPARIPKWILRLKSLKVGEFIAVGPLIVDGKSVDRPIKVKLVFDAIQGNSKSTENSPSMKNKVEIPLVKKSSKEEQSEKTLEKEEKDAVEN